MPGRTVVGLTRREQAESLQGHEDFAGALCTPPELPPGQPRPASSRRARSVFALLDAPLDSRFKDADATFPYGNRRPVGGLDHDPTKRGGSQVESENVRKAFGWKVNLHVLAP